MSNPLNENKSFSYYSQKRLAILNYLQFGGAVIVFCVITVIFLTKYISHERYVYFWDNAGYWVIAKNITGLLKLHDYKDFIRHILQTIRHDDYNATPVVFPSLFLWLAGSTSRLAFVLAIDLFYCLPAACLLSIMVKELPRAFRVKIPNTRTALMIGFCAVLIQPIFWEAVLRGQPDVGGLCFIFGVYILYFKDRDLSQYLRAIAIGVLLAGLYLFRRWYLFWVVSFFATALLDSIITGFYHRKGNLRSFLTSTKYLLVSFLAFVLTIFGLAAPLVHKIVITQYTDIYSGYKLGESRLGLILGLLKDIGWGMLFIWAIALFGLILSRKLRRAGVFFAFQCILIVCLFSSVQYFDIQHKYLILATLMPATVLFFNQVCQSLTERKIFITSCILLLAGGFFMLLAFDRELSPIAGQLSNYLPHQYWGVNRTGSQPFYSLRRSDVPELIKLLAAIKRETADDGENFYVLASSAVLNSNIIDNADISLGTAFNLRSKNLITADVDKRDNFPYSKLANASLLVVATPAQYHLNPLDQRVIGLPLKAIEDRQNIGKAFVRLPEQFHLDDGVTVHLYKRKYLVTPIEIDQLKMKFQQAYPDCGKYKLC